MDIPPAERPSGEQPTAAESAAPDLEQFEEVSLDSLSEEQYQTWRLTGELPKASAMPPAKKTVEAPRELDEPKPEEPAGFQTLSKHARGERERIIAAFERLGVSPEKYLPLVGPEPPRIHQALMFAEKFSFPPRNSYEQTEREWIALADAAYRALRDKLVENQRAWQKLGIDPPAGIQRRGPGKTARNAKVNDAYEWAAKRLLGEPWKEIAAQYPMRTDLDKRANTVSKAASTILNAAGIPYRN